MFQHIQHTFFFKSLHEEDFEPLIPHSNDAVQKFNVQMKDWFDPKKEFYNLKEKLNSVRFIELLQIVEDKHFDVVCLRIIYQYFHESDPIIDVCTRVDNLCDISVVLKITNRSFRTELLKLIVVHWKTEITPHDYETVKQQILQSLEESEKSFFRMSFYLHENLVNKFEFELEKHIEYLTEKFGDFHEYFVMPDLPLLLVIMKRKNLYKTVDFMFVRCPYMKYNSSILSMLKTTQDHQRFILDDFDDQGFSVSSRSNFQANLNLISNFT